MGRTDRTEEVTMGQFKRSIPQYTVEQFLEWIAKLEDEPAKLDRGRWIASVYLAMVSCDSWSPKDWAYVWYSDDITQILDEETLQQFLDEEILEIMIDNPEMGGLEAIANLLHNIETRCFN